MAHGDVAGGTARRTWPLVTFNRLCASGLECHQPGRVPSRQAGRRLHRRRRPGPWSRSPGCVAQSRSIIQPGNLGATTTLGWRFPNRVEAMFPLEIWARTAENIYELSCDATGPLTSGPIHARWDAFAGKPAQGGGCDPQPTLTTIIARWRCPSARDRRWSSIR